MTQLAIVDAYTNFLAVAQPCLVITSESDYNGALETLEQVMESASDTLDDPLNPLIDMITQAIEKYERQDNELVDFINEAASSPTDLALLRTLMSQHKLTGSDLPEIGDKTMVSKVLNGKRELSRHAIEKLCKRFTLQPAMFF
jgi:HTH-type transcriptional regulator/antitoxin HigA